MASDLIDATWVGPGEQIMADGTRLTPGETVVQLPRAEAEASSNWDPVTEKAATKAAAKPSEGES